MFANIFLHDLTCMLIDGTGFWKLLWRYLSTVEHLCHHWQPLLHCEPPTLPSSHRLDNLKFAKFANMNSVWTSDNKHVCDSSIRCSSSVWSLKLPSNWAFGRTPQQGSLHPQTQRHPKDMCRTWNIMESHQQRKMTEVLNGFNMF